MMKKRNLLVDLQGAGTNRAVVYRLTNVLKAEVDFEFPMTDLLMLEIYLRSGISKRVILIEELLKNEFVADYLRQFGPFEFANFEQHLKTMEKAGSRYAQMLLLRGYDKLDGIDKVNKSIEDMRFSHDIIWSDYCTASLLEELLMEIFALEWSAQSRVTGVNLTVSNHRCVHKLTRSAANMDWHNPCDDADHDAVIFEAATTMAEVMHPDYGDRLLRWIIEQSKQHTTEMALANWYTKMVAPYLEFMETSAQVETLRLVYKHLMKAAKQIKEHCKFAIDMGIRVAEIHIMLNDFQGARFGLLSMRTALKTHHPSDQKRYQKVLELSILAMDGERYVERNFEMIKEFGEIPSSRLTEAFRERDQLDLVLEIMRNHSPHVPKWITNSVVRMVEKFRNGYGIKLVVRHHEQLKAALPVDSVVRLRSAMNVIDAIRSSFMMDANFEDVKERLLSDINDQFDDVLIAFIDEYVTNMDAMKWFLRTIERGYYKFFNGDKAYRVADAMIHEYAETKGYLNKTCADIALLLALLNRRELLLVEDSLLERLDWIVANVYGEHSNERLQMLKALIEKEHEHHEQGVGYNRRNRDMRTFERGFYVDEVQSVLKILQADEEKRDSSYYYDKYQKYLAEALTNAGDRLSAEQFLLAKFDEELMALRSKSTFHPDWLPLITEFYRNQNRVDEAFACYLKVSDVHAAKGADGRLHLLETFNQKLSFMRKCSQRQYLRKHARNFNEEFYPLIIHQFLEPMKTQRRYDWKLIERAISMLLNSDFEEHKVYAVDFFKSTYPYALTSSLIAEGTAERSSFLRYQYQTKKLADSMVRNERWSELLQLYLLTFKSFKEGYMKRPQDSDHLAYIRNLSSMVGKFAVDSEEFDVFRLICKELLVLLGPNHPQSLKLRRGVDLDVQSYTGKAN